MRDLGGRDSLPARKITEAIREKSRELVCAIERHFFESTVAETKQF